MSNYEQHMKHWGNHRKDRFVQQCSGYAGNGASEIDYSKKDRIEAETFHRLLEEAKSAVFPIYIVGSGGFWTICNEKNLFATKIDSYEELAKFGKECVLNDNDYF